MGNYLCVHKMLDVSTLHLKVSTLNWLRDEAESEEPGSFIAYAKFGYGFFIPIIEERDLPEDTPNDLKTLLNFADEVGCHWIMIDRDGYVINQLPKLYDEEV